MEEKKKSNVGLIVFLVILVLGLAGYICYDKFLSTNNNLKCKENKCNCSNTANNDTEITNNDTNAKYTYEDIAGIYECKVVPTKEEAPDGDVDNFTYNGELDLLSDGTIYFTDGIMSASGYIGNYVIDGNQIKVTIWFTFGSYYGLSLPKYELTTTYKIIDKNTMSVAKKDGKTYEYKKNTLAEPHDFKNINDFLSEDDVFAEDEGLLAR